MNDLRVYVADIDQYDLGNELANDHSLLDLTDEQFVNESERQGLVYTLKGFEEALNSEDLIPTNHYIRILNVNSNTQ